jgi:hypothetical protein
VGTAMAIFSCLFAAAEKEKSKEKVYVGTAMAIFSWLNYNK